MKPVYHWPQRKATLSVSIPPVKSAQTAVQAAIVADSKGKK
jgi:hypothetical protein